MPAQRTVHDKAMDQRAKLLFGVSVICGFFLIETFNAHQQMPHPASPYIWAALGSLGVGALVYGAWCWQRARREAPPTPP
jgi:drug/metabolite transporter (DMT)-like permease